MSQPATLAPRARAELLDAVQWIAQSDEAAARRLQQAAGVAVRLIGTRPLAGRMRPDLAPRHFRFWALTRFPYLLVYDTRTRPPRIARIVHMARDLEPLLADLSGDADARRLGRGSVRAP